MSDSCVSLCILLGNECGAEEGVVNRNEIGLRASLVLR
jgi:hypothetical protein